jgi:hypothetical protein
VNPEDYKAFCARGDVLGRPLLLESQRVLRGAEPELALLVGRVLAQAPIAKPPEHAGDSLTDHFQVQLSSEDVTRIVTAFGLMEAEGNYRAGELLDGWNRILWFRHDPA